MIPGMDYSLILFDADGTLNRWNTRDVLPGVAEWFDAYWNLCPRLPEVAIITNQGGPACRDAGWNGDFPSLEGVTGQGLWLAGTFGCAVYVALAYETSTGRWVTPHGDNDMVNPPESDVWLSDRQEWRKPGIGMIERACQDHFTAPRRCLVVGDRPEDQKAAANAGSAFLWAHDFFRRAEPVEVE